MTAVVERPAEVDRFYRLMNTGLVVSRELTKDEWVSVGRRLAAMRDATAWAIGDWLIYGKGRGEYGDAYTLAQEITGRSFDSLSQYSRVSAAFGLSERVRGASWTTHREALRLPRKERSGACTKPIKKGHKWFFGSDSRVRHRNCDQPDSYTTHQEAQEASA